MVACLADITDTKLPKAQPSTYKLCVSCLWRRLKSLRLGHRHSGKTVQQTRGLQTGWSRMRWKIPWKHLRLYSWAFQFLAICLFIGHALPAASSAAAAQHAKVTTLPELVEAAKALRQRLPVHAFHGHGHRIHRGILIAAGGNDMLAAALSTVKAVRTELNCTLPIEVTHHGKDEFNAELVKMLEAVPNVTVMDTAQVRLPEQHYVPDKVHGYLKKILAVYASQFDQVLYLDSDNLPLLDPAFMFDWDAFKMNGAVFWPDYVGADQHESPQTRAWQDFNMDPPWLFDPGWRSTESGQFLLDRRRHADVLEWLLFLNSYPDVVYKQVSYGDKDTFELAFALAEKHADFYRILQWPRAALGNITEGALYRHHGILQNTPRGVPAFLHRTSGGKLRLERAPAEMQPPAYATRGVSPHARVELQWHSEFSNLGLPQQATVQPEQLDCTHLDLATTLIVEAHEPKFAGCRFHRQSHKLDVPLPLLPLTWFPPIILDTISAALTAFQQVQAIVLEPDAESF